MDYICKKCSILWYIIYISYFFQEFFIFISIYLKIIILGIWINIGEKMIYKIFFVFQDFECMLGKQISKSNYNMISVLVFYLLYVVRLRKIKSIGKFVRCVRELVVWFWLYVLQDWINREMIFE